MTIGELRAKLNDLIFAWSMMTDQEFWTVHTLRALPSETPVSPEWAAYLDRLHQRYRGPVVYHPEFAGEIETCGIESETK